MISPFFNNSRKNGDDVEPFISDKDCKQEKSPTFTLTESEAYLASTSDPKKDDAPAVFFSFQATYSQQNFRLLGRIRNTSTRGPKGTAEAII